MMDEEDGFDDFEDIDDLYLREIALASVEIKLDLKGNKGLAMVVSNLRDGALEAINLIISCPPTETEEIRRLQGIIGQYDSICAAIRNTLALGQDLPIDPASDQLQRIINPDEEKD